MHNKQSETDVVTSKKWVHRSSVQESNNYHTQNIASNSCSKYKIR